MNRIHAFFLERGGRGAVALQIAALLGLQSMEWLHPGRMSLLHVKSEFASNWRK
jgi:hypothetical protein